MMPLQEIWNILHDGVIEAIEGSVPGNVRLRIGIQYLRDMLNSKGGAIYLHLDKCRLFEMKIWKEGITTDQLESIACLKTEILNTDSESMPVEVITTLGELFADYEDIRITLDEGETVSFEELYDACQRYWNKLREKK